ncbi:hypothetical protein FRX31_005368 [Thalictrum thalictroides]|uniref:Uncharacterized protein n=1 Tax=Thalictrum thalictroides TaxID=46969 RepID=A0A7J6X6L4_THATH|nr:hypothetical protein FRX31_005368 [Thalictrum thalictroides]
MENDERQRNAGETSTSKHSKAISNFDLVTEPQNYYHKPVLPVFFTVYRIPAKVHICYYMRAVKDCEFQIAPKEICVTLGHIKTGLRLPLTQLDPKILNFYGLAPGQVVGNFWKFMYCFNKMKEDKYDITLDEIHRFVRLNSTVVEKDTHYKGKASKVHPTMPLLETDKIEILLSEDEVDMEEMLGRDGGDDGADEFDGIEDLSGKATFFMIPKSNRSHRSERVDHPGNERTVPKEHQNLAYVAAQFLPRVFSVFLTIRVYCKVSLVGNYMARQIDYYAEKFAKHQAKKVDVEQKLEKATYDHKLVVNDLEGRIASMKEDFIKEKAQSLVDQDVDYTQKYEKLKVGLTNDVNTALATHKDKYLKRIRNLENQLAKKVPSTSRNC